ncbi:MAG TPA: Rieske (2Fe-2S) protein [Parafilimonas sp.]|nr:Rieske (2Fe-2S) protein [Parafilimonas sp.]
MHRRKFISSSCKICLLGAAGYSVLQSESCSPASSVFKTPITEGNLNVPLNLFDKSALQIVRPNGWYYDVAVQKNADNSYTALLLQCTHQENQLTPTGNGYHCSLHGSNFDKQGNVRKGPAEHPLYHFETSVNNDILNIHINNFKP